MTTTYQLKAFELTEDFVRKFRNDFQNEDVIITVKEAYDETAYLLGNEANRKHLLKGIEAVKLGKFAHVTTLEKLEAFVE